METESQGVRMTVLYSDRQILVLAIQQKDVRKMTLTKKAIVGMAGLEIYSSSEYSKSQEKPQKFSSIQ